MGVIRNFRNLATVINAQTAVVVFLAVMSTWICVRFGWQAEIPTGLIGLAVVFPIVFSINAAYRRREEALRYFGALKAHAVAVYYAHRDWVPQVEGGEEHAARAAGLMQELIERIRDHFLEAGGRTQETFDAVYGVFSRFSDSNEIVRKAGVPPNEVSRVSQYLSKMIVDFERMRNILDYRTPLSLRAYSYVFLNGFPIIFGPYFATLAADYYPTVGYLVAATYSVVLVTLDNIQEDLEDPFDQIGTDDVRLDVFPEYEGLVRK